MPTAAAAVKFNDARDITFGGGPRMCIGDRFSIMEQTLALAMVAQKFRVQVVNDHPIRPDPVFTLRPSGGIRATLAKR